ncbi:fumarylacetoacetate hydrolase family protein [Wenzhouxiangella sp. XN79A]|uniref:fumarylacetoacetate hydrolase family protein n=1 Tax=Wenzhouxiangella sp. XN79A TaxID=2724193 RepID=UPI00144AB923|nr:fumarylacetoacetate hydrolase family protein [Wenzhouxiangella sp. XN79A]NKI34024.1 fumarylacetoacetate hydrolase family protein [Wenzhouxiangella sp. XN79A]
MPHTADWSPPALRGSDDARFPIRHAWCVGRNYAEHAREMGADPKAGTPIFFTKPATALTQAATVPFPPATEELHHEVELVALLGQGGRNLDAAAGLSCVVGWAVGCDLTRRDVQARAKQAGHPWALAKGFDASGPMGRWASAEDWMPQPTTAIRLAVNGIPRQQAVLGDMIWPVGELIARLSHEVTLHPGDVLFTGTPAGVGVLEVGDRVEARIDGLPALDFEIVAPGI